MLSHQISPNSLSVYIEIHYWDGVKSLTLTSKSGCVDLIP